MASRNSAGKRDTRSLYLNDTIDIAATFPPKFAPFFQPKRTKVLYGGRSAAKSHSIARALLLLGHQSPLRILCARQFQSSMQESVHRLLCDQIVNLGLQGFYHVEAQRIQGPPIESVNAAGVPVIKQTEFTFSGIATNINKIRSTEGVSICWIEEAAQLDAYSFSIIEPTIRGEGYIPGTSAELWLSFNPDLASDFVYQKFVANPVDESKCLVIKMDYQDNPFCPQSMIDLAEDTKKRSMDEYRWVWGGEPRRMMEGAVYGRELREAETEGRITKVPYDPSVAVSVFFDLGYQDCTAIWFVQKVGHELHFIDYYENIRQSLDHYLKIIGDKPYAIDRYFLPHDAKAKSLGTGQSTEEIMRSKGKSVVVLPKLDLADGINAVRHMFPNLWIDRNKCAVGLEALRGYSYDRGWNGEWKDTPAHNRFSHAADCARYCAIAIRYLNKSKYVERSKYSQEQHDRQFFGGHGQQNTTSWMTI